jgi:hypothetical protein
LDIPEDSEFPLENIPFGVFSRKGHPTKHPATRIGINV